MIKHLNPGDWVALTIFAIWVVSFVYAMLDRGWKTPPELQGLVAVAATYLLGGKYLRKDKANGKEQHGSGERVQ